MPDTNSIFVVSISQLTSTALQNSKGFYIVPASTIHFDNINALWKHFLVFLVVLGAFA